MQSRSKNEPIRFHRSTWSFGDMYIHIYIYTYKHYICVWSFYLSSIGFKNMFSCKNHVPSLEIPSMEFPAVIYSSIHDMFQLSSFITCEPMIAFCPVFLVALEGGHGMGLNVLDNMKLVFEKQFHNLDAPWTPFHAATQRSSISSCREASYCGMSPGTCILTRRTQHSGEGIWAHVFIFVWIDTYNLCVYVWNLCKYIICIFYILNISPVRLS